MAEPTPIAVTSVRLTDNGDGDDWADSHETVTVRVTLYNRGAVDLTNVVADVTTDSPHVACVSDATVEVGDMPAGATVNPADGFTFAVGAIERTDAFEDLSATFAITIDGDGLPSPVEYDLVLDLDLDAGGGGSHSAWFEGFEAPSGLGAFTASNLDTGLSSLADSDGYRCQYSDPDWVNSNSYGEPAGDWCFPGTNPAQAAEFHWQIDGPLGGRAYSGIRSLYMGIPLSGGDGWTTPTGSLEAVETTAPVDLSFGRVCSMSRTLGCATDGACPAGESCVAVAPDLSFKHQVSLMDERTVAVPGLTADRAVVQLQLADADGAAVGPWFTIEPWLNVYDVAPAHIFTNCMFDPTDDGRTEDDFFDPADPDRRLGPSSTCFPAKVFAYLGDTDEPFDPANVGRASDGPGLEGQAGSGTWVESRFRLDRWRGRSARIRFLATSLKIQFADSWEGIFQDNPHPNDDGWWIDDVLVADALTAPAVLIPDMKDNSTLVADGDLDGALDACDCDPTDGATWSIPGAVRDLRLDHAGGATGTTHLQWQPPSEPGSEQLVYDALRSGGAAFDGAICIESGDGSDTAAVDVGVPPSGGVFYYLVRAADACGTGLLDSAGGVGPACS